MDSASRPIWKTTATKYLVNDRWLKVRADTCLTPDGDLLDPWYVLEYPDWVNCVAIDADDNIILLQHYRHGAGLYVPEIVGGKVETGDSPITAIRKELQEEIGYVAGELYPTGIAYPNPSNQDNRLHAFLALGGRCTDDRQKEIGSDFSIEKVPFIDFLKTMADPASRTRYQCMHVTSVFFALNYIRKSEVESENLARLRAAIGAAGVL